MKKIINKLINYSLVIASLFILGFLAKCLFIIFMAGWNMIGG